MRALNLFALCSATLGLVFVTSLGGCAHHKTTAKGSGTGLASGTGWDNGDQELNPCAVRVHFEYDSTEIPERDRPALASSATCFKGDPSLKATIEGNADERGTEEYNLALGDKRAITVAKYLKSLGAEPDQMKTVSFGEENPVCADHHESCWSKNRRAAVRPHGESGSKKD